MEKSLSFKFEDLPREKLIKYAEFLLRHYRLVDAYWFLKVEDNLGLKTSTKFNEEIWTKLAEVSARDIMKYMGVKKGNLNNLIEAIKYFPWTIIANWKIEEQSSERVVIYADKCPPQEARMKMGKKVFGCKDMELRLYKNFAKMFNSKIKVKCLNAPPDPKPDDCWCKFEFTLK